MEPVDVFVGAGSNDDSARNLRSAVADLRALYGPLLLSAVYETPPIGCGGADFLNFVLGFKTTQSPREVFETLRRIEYRHGRRYYARKQGPFPLDLDILLYGDLVDRDTDLEIPSEDIVSRAFVLGPLAELIPNATHPLLGLSYAQLWEAFGHVAGIMRPVPFFWANSGEVRDTALS